MVVLLQRVRSSVVACTRSFGMMRPVSAPTGATSGGSISRSLASSRGFSSSSSSDDSSSNSSSSSSSSSTASPSSPTAQTASLAALARSPAKFFFVGGKGGTGKTTTAAALASHFSRTKKTLVVSTDPAHSLADAFATTLNSQPRQLDKTRKLYGMEIDPQQQLEALKKAIAMDEIKESIRRNQGGLGAGMLTFMDSVGIDTKMLHQMLDMSPPGVDEAIAISQLAKYDHSSEKFEKIVVDTAPTGHTLRLLSFPRFLLVSFPVLGFLARSVAPTATSGLVGQAVARAVGIDQLLRYVENTEKKLLELQGNMDELNKKLTNPALCEFVVVATPTALAVEETKRLMVTLREFNIANHQLVINQMPAEPASAKALDAIAAQLAQPTLGSLGGRDGTTEEHPWNAELRAGFERILEDGRRQVELYERARGCVDEMSEAGRRTHARAGGKAGGKPNATADSSGTNGRREFEVREIPIFPGSLTGLEGLEGYEAALMGDEIR